MNNNGIEDYTEIAKEYDELRYVTDTQLFLDSLRNKSVNECLKPNTDMTIIDVGTGTGSGIIFFAKSVKKMVGLDGTEAMLDRAKEKIQKSGICNVDLVHANALEIPFEDETFDNVISLNFIHLFVPLGIDKQKEFISEMERVCKKGGKVIIEFDNALYLGLGNNYSDLTVMSDRMKIDNIVGTYLPKTGALHKINIQLTRLYAKLANIPFLRRFAYKWIVQYRKV